MKATRWEGGDLRLVLRGMITDPTVCARIAGQWQRDGLFGVDWADLLAGWCVRHHRKYGQPPDGKLTGIFERWADRPAANEETVSAIERFLGGLSAEHETEEEQAADYVLDVAGNVFNKARLRDLVDAVSADLDAGYVKDAQARLQTLQKVELGPGAVIKPAEDPEFFIRAFQSERRKAMIEFPKALGQFFGDSLQRGMLYAFMAPDKTGKSFWLLDLAIMATRQRRKVAYFDVGDNSEDDMAERIGQRVAGLPLYGEDVDIPVGWNGTTGEPICESANKERLTDAAAIAAMQHICRKGDTFRLCCYPNSTVNVGDLDVILGTWELEGWRPDVVVIDYADILAPPTGMRDSLEEIDETWKSLRRMTQQRHLLCLTATQTSATAYGDKLQVLSRKHFGGRKTKLAHVNGMIGINVTPREKEVGVARLNWVVRRKGKHSERGTVKVAGCLAIGRPAIISSF